MFGYIVYRRLSIMTKFNVLIKSAFIGTVGVVGSLFFLKKYNYKRTNMAVPTFFTHASPYIFARRGGMAVRPEHTQLAFDYANNHKVTGFDIDIRLTQDYHLVAFHDSELDLTTNGSGAVMTHNLAELQHLDAGYYFTDINKHHPYRDHHLAKILSLSEVLTKYPNQLIIVHILDAPDTTNAHRIPKLLFDIIVQHHAQHRVVVMSPFVEHLTAFADYNEEEIAVGASQKEMTEAFIKYILGIGHTFKPKSHFFQLTPQINHTKRLEYNYIQWLLRLNIVPSYSPVNNLDLMQELTKHGVHSIVTDRPDLAQRFNNIK